MYPQKIRPIQSVLGHEFLIVGHEFFCSNHNKEVIMFKLVSKYKPSGDQPQAIKKLVDGINNGEKHQVLLGRLGQVKLSQSQM